MAIGHVLQNLISSSRSISALWWTGNTMDGVLGSSQKDQTLKKKFKYIYKTNVWDDSKNIKIMIWCQTRSVVLIIGNCDSTLLFVSFSNTFTDDAHAWSQTVQCEVIQYAKCMQEADGAKQKIHNEKLV